jgi:two-component system sensor kinase FixL
MAALTAVCLTALGDRHGDILLTAAILLTLATALAAALIVQRVRGRRVEERLRRNEQAMQLAANAAQLVMWDWDVVRDEMWMSGADRVSHRGLETFLATIHPEDREGARRAIQGALDGEDAYETEYRVVHPDGTTRWLAGRGRVEHFEGTPRWMRGVALDITRRKAAELDAQHQRNELAHLSRVSILGELSGSVAHELNQPLMAILSNAQAARMFIKQETVDLVELDAILDDIVESDKRAGDIIRGLRKMLKKEDRAHESVAVNELVHDVLRLMRSDLMSRGITAQTQLSTGSPSIRGDRVQLQQVLLNLILNACDSMFAQPRGERTVRVCTECADGRVKVSVIDRGTGIPAQSMREIFSPFYTTKVHGLGLGLSVCTSIVASHGGQLQAANNPGGGSTFTFVMTETKAAA